MSTTPDLIQSLAAAAKPVARLRPPWQRAGVWIVGAVLLVVLAGAHHGIRADLAAKLAQPDFLMTVAAAFLTGAAAAFAAFQVSLPDRSSAWLLLPLPSLVLWISGIGYGCLANWVDLARSGADVAEAPSCLAIIASTSLPLGLLLLVMLRHAGPIRPTLTATLGALSIAAIAAGALALIHDIDATLLVILWNMGTLAVFVGVAGVLGRSLFAMPALPKKG